jgi:ABC-type oligopeptide transport system ATPase subunit
MTVGGFASFVTAMLMLVNPIKHLSEIAGPITRGLAALERGLELIENTPQETGGQHRSAHARGHIQWENLGVRYQADHPWALREIHLDVLAGETVALVGSSGSGKTTLANLLPRFVDWTEGDLKLDGVSVRDWYLPDLRRQFAMVSQNVVVLNDSLAMNVALGQTPEPEKVLRCLEAANLGDYLRSLPPGIDTVVYDGPLSKKVVSPGVNGREVSRANNSEGSDWLLSIERLQFKDKGLAFVFDGHAGVAAKTLGLVFGPEAVRVPQYMGICLDYLDNKQMTAAQLMHEALAVRLGADAQNTEKLVSFLYERLTGMAPIQSEKDKYVGWITSGAYTADSLAVYASELALNPVVTQLTGMAATGSAFEMPT